jgi:hypothetical protein
MSPLNIHPEENVDTSKKKKSNKTLKVLLGVGVLVLVPVIGTTLAANITITPAEGTIFAQGQSATVACDSAVTISGASVFTGSGTDGSYVLDQVRLKDVNLASGAGQNGGCAGHTLIVSAASRDISNTIAEIGLQQESDYQFLRATVAISSDGTSASCSDTYNDAVTSAFSCSISGSDIVIQIANTAWSVESTSIDQFLLQEAS